MVKVIEKKEEEIRAEKRFSKLAEIAQNNFTPKRVLESGQYISIGDEKDSSSRYILVEPFTSTILVYDKQGFTPALALAKSYEELVDQGVEWTLKKNYTET